MCIHAVRRIRNPDKKWLHNNIILLYYCVTFLLFLHFFKFDFYACEIGVSLLFCSIYTEPETRLNFFDCVVNNTKQQLYMHGTDARRYSRCGFDWNKHTNKQTRLECLLQVRFIDILVWRHTNVRYCREPLDLYDKVAVSQIVNAGYSTLVNPSLS